MKSEVAEDDADADGDELAGVAVDVATAMCCIRGKRAWFVCLSVFDELVFWPGESAVSCGLFA